MGKLILVVEDEDEGLEVRVAADGREALAGLASRGGASLVLLDLPIPEMDGLEFLRRQLQDSELSKVPVVNLSGDTSSQAKARTMGFSEIISKPFREEDLLRLLSGYIQPN
jgi:CheY-like chemotaxis protein